MADLTAQDKLKEICNALLVETLKPAEEQADLIIHDAKARAKQIIQEAQEQAQKIVQAASSEAQHKLTQGEQALIQAGKRSVESLKQVVETKILKESLLAWLDDQLAEATVATTLITTLIQAVEKEGLSGNLIAYIGKHVPARDINQQLCKAALSKLKDQTIEVGTFSSGVQLKVVDKNLVIDLSADAIADLLIRYLQHDFRKMIFQDM